VFKKDYQLCSFGNAEVVCLQHGQFTIYCTDERVPGAPSDRATALSKIRIVFNIDGYRLSFQADKFSFGDKFTNSSSIVEGATLNVIKDRVSLPI
jgi:hypothetical protein